MTEYRSFSQARTNLNARFRIYGEKVHTERWQGVNVSKRPDMVTYELLNETFTVNLFGEQRLEHYREDIKPNLPWADDHFQERVCGAPLNPGVEWANWPWASSADKHREGEMFNHTYMERLWPRFAGKFGPLTTKEQFQEQMNLHILEREEFTSGETHMGIRGEYGDLGTLVDKLAWEPLTRQAYIPLYFPEDTGLQGRMPCTLGYQFILRQNKLHLYYPLRSCDFVRHWPDDCYLGVRLLLWMIEQCKERNPIEWRNVEAGKFTMHCTSFHVFANDFREMGGKL